MASHGNPGEPRGSAGSPSIPPSPSTGVWSCPPPRRLPDPSLPAEPFPFILAGGRAVVAWSYEEALAWLYARQALGVKLGLGKVERLLAALGDPHLAYRVVHVAGTNGKGSVARMVA